MCYSGCCRENRVPISVFSIFEKKSSFYLTGCIKRNLSLMDTNF